jgi:hypothetical protein
MHHASKPFPMPFAGADRPPDGQRITRPGPATRIGQGHGWYTLAAAAPYEPALERPAGDLSYLTAALIDVLRDGSAVDKDDRAAVSRVCEQVTTRLAHANVGHTPMTSAHEKTTELYIARKPPQAANLAAARLALADRDYGRLAEIFRLCKEDTRPDVAYYRSLKMLAGGRPREFRTEEIVKVEAVLRSAIGGAAHAAALLALIKEDHYVLRGMADHPPTISSLIPAAEAILPMHAAEIVTHVRAPECRTWRWLEERMNLDHP